MEPNRSQNFFMRMGIAKTEQTANLIAIIIIALCLWFSYTTLFAKPKQPARPLFDGGKSILDSRAQMQTQKNSIPRASAEL